MHLRKWLSFIFFASAIAPLAAMSAFKLSPGEGGLTNEQLIDSLANISSEGTGFNSFSMSSTFMAINEEPQFHGGIIGSPKPTVPPAMRELVRRGVKALPDLLKHLSDPRSTKLLVAGGGIIVDGWFSDEYHPRWAEPEKQPKNVNRLDDDGGQINLKAGYVPRVGDLCYVLVGQIVNRGLNAVRYQPSSCVVVNSPVQIEALATATRKDWGDLTAEAHKRSLIEDADNPYSYAALNALKRLLYYYPEVGEKFALRFLGRPYYDPLVIWQFIEKTLMKHAKPGEWKEDVATFVRRYGKVYAEALPSKVWSDARHAFDRKRPKPNRALEILLAVYPNYGLYHHKFLNATTIRDQADLVEGLQIFRSAALDDAVQRAFSAAKAFAKNVSVRFEVDMLALAAVARLEKSKYAPTYLHYFQQRIAYMNKLDVKSPDRYRLDDMKKWATKLRK
jgi:hypothetical protein